MYSTFHRIAIYPEDSVIFIRTTSAGTVKKSSRVFKAIDMKATKDTLPSEKKFCRMCIRLVSICKGSILTKVEQETKQLNNNVI